MSRASADTLRSRVLVVDDERELIVAALRRTRGVQKQAAEALKLKPTTLNEKIKRLGITV